LLLLACEAALYPTLLAAVVVLLAQPNRFRLIAVYLVGGLITSITIGLVIVHLLDASGELKGSGSTLSWTADLVIGALALLATIALVLHADARVRARHDAKRPPKPPDAGREPWSARLLSRGSTPIVFAAALIINVPGAAYLIGLKDIAADHDSTAKVVVLVVGFNLIMFLLAEIPLVGLLIAPARVERLINALNAWLSRHGRDVAVGLCLALGLFLCVRGVIRS
jgi:hypothetical protein